jgi:hypothetical protein
MKIVLAVAALLFVLVVAPTEAQSEIQPQPSQTDLPKPAEMSAPEVHFEHSNRRFWILAAIQVGATVADAETTQWALRSHPDAREINPLFGARPDRARMYGIAFSITALQILMQHHVKTVSERTGKMPNAWIVGASVNTGFHTFLAIHNARLAGASICPANGSGCR